MAMPMASQQGGRPRSGPARTISEYFLEDRG
jgi:hypothetical protein